VEYYLAREIANTMEDRLHSSGEVASSTGITTIDFWLEWAFSRATFDDDGGWGFVNRLAEKRAQLATDAIKPLLELSDSSWDNEHMPTECTPGFWVERAKQRAAERVSCQINRPEITTLMSVTEAGSLNMVA
jgi:hypothetical protein